MAWVPQDDGLPSVWVPQGVQEAQTGGPVPVDDGRVSTWVAQAGAGQSMTQRQYEATVASEAHAAAAAAAQTQIGIWHGEIYVWHGDVFTWRNEVSAWRNDVATDRAVVAADRAAVATDRAAVEGVYDSFDDRYLGPKSTPPTTDNDGAALLVGALYWDIPLATWRGWNGTAWVSPQTALHTHVKADITDFAHTHPWGEITGIPTTFPPSAHTHPWGEVTGKPATFPPDAHTHLWAHITDKPATFPPSAHGHAIADVTNLQGALDGKANLSGPTFTGRTTAPELVASGTGALVRVYDRTTPANFWDWYGNSDQFRLHFINGANTPGLGTGDKFQMGPGGRIWTARYGDLEGFFNRNLMTINNIELGGSVAGNQTTYIDFHTSRGDHAAAPRDFDFRILRHPGSNGAVEFSNIGTGHFGFNRQIAIEGRLRAIGEGVNFHDGAIEAVSATNHVVISMHASGASASNLRHRRSQGGIDCVNSDSTAWWTFFAAAFSVQSDYRTKENISTAGAEIDTLMALRPVWYDPKQTDDVPTKVLPAKRGRFRPATEKGTDMGFIAHELEEVFPLAVTGKKDAVGPDGEMLPQSVDYGRITPLLTAALQDAIKRIRTLEDRVKALEAKTPAPAPTPAPGGQPA